MMTDSPAQLSDAINLRQTAYFIRYNPRLVVLTRRPRVADGAGGWRHGTPYVAEAQTMRLLGYTGQQGGYSQRVTDAGAIVTVTHILIGMPSCVVVPDDQFTVDGVLHEVVTVNRDPPWRVEAEVFQHAG